MSRGSLLARLTLRSKNRPPASRHRPVGTITGREPRSDQRKARWHLDIRAPRTEDPAMSIAEQLLLLAAFAGALTLAWIAGRAWRAGKRRYTLATAAAGLSVSVLALLLGPRLFAPALALGGALMGASSFATIGLGFSRWVALALLLLAPALGFAWLHHGPAPVFELGLDNEAQAALLVEQVGIRGDGDISLLYASAIESKDLAALFQRAADERVEALLLSAIDDDTAAIAQRRGQLAGLPVFLRSEGQTSGDFAFSATGYLLVLSLAPEGEGGAAQVEWLERVLSERRQPHRFCLLVSPWSLVESDEALTEASRQAMLELVERYSVNLIARPGPGLLLERPSGLHEFALGSDDSAGDLLRLSVTPYEPRAQIEALGAAEDRVREERSRIELRLIQGGVARCLLDGFGLAGLLAPLFGLLGGFARIAGRR